ncbi:TPA: [acyl-carrier-protein] S-malonyltransferase [candidate division WOR-3 bacterium]|uniref:Malonyl CoA-acyl carrier protein transacylase n=1 Tax=candidate division WOR-3 bacterium TaxID=2052148 RepID=A0A350H884_UNCW3|nr:[acyl-carrier-protein] S-malonyltransferase [candidate division WOR-3 bacterium]
MKRILMFPGQGAQYVGMCRDLYQSNAEIKNLFDTVSIIINDDIADIMFNGPDSRLTESRNAQVAILLHSYSAYTLIKNKIEPIAACGHSLGEYTALLSADVFDFETAVKLVRRRGELMSEAGEKAKGAMAAVIGMDVEKIEEAVKEIEGIVVANYNGDGQTVISGTVEGIDNAVKKFGEMGAKRVLKLNVSGAFHSPLMNYAYEEFSSFIDKFTFNNPKIPVIMNVTADYQRDADKIKELLKMQIVSPVRWTQIMKLMLNDGHKNLAEVGPSKVLSGMAKKTSDQFDVISVEKSEDISF